MGIKCCLNHNYCMHAPQKHITYLGIKLLLEVQLIRGFGSLDGKKTAFLKNGLNVRCIEKNNKI